jgi:anti-repressor protein
MSVLPQSHHHPKTGELILDPPQPRVTPKGIQRLLMDMGDRQS